MMFSAAAMAQEPPAALQQGQLLAQSGGVDFMAGIRGYERARQDMHQQQMRKLRRQQMRRTLRPDASEVADNYLSPLLNNRRKTLQAGDSAQSFWHKQRAAIVNDSSFQQYPAKVQILILRRMRQLHAALDGNE